MCHEHAHPILFEKSHHGMVIPHIIPVAIAIYSYERFESGDLLHHCAGAEIAGMPYDIDRLQKPAHLLVEVSVRIGNQADVSHQIYNFMMIFFR